MSKQSGLIVDSYPRNSQAFPRAAIENRHPTKEHSLPKARSNSQPTSRNPRAKASCLTLFRHLAIPIIPDASRRPLPRILSRHIHSHRPLLDPFMPNYGSLHSPSLKKHNNMAEYRRGGRFEFGNIIGDPFALATISISLVRHSTPFRVCRINHTDNQTACMADYLHLLHCRPSSACASG